MLFYLAKRLLLFIPMAWLVSLLAFALSEAGPGDPIEQSCLGDNSGALTPEDYLRCARQHKFDKPAFYFALQARAYPDTLYKILPLPRRQKLRKLIAQTGNWPAVQQWQKTLDAQRELYDSLDTEQRALLDALDQSNRLEEIANRLSYLQKTAEVSASAHLAKAEEALSTAFRQMQSGRNFRALYTPALRWHGFDNRYHHWLRSLLRGDLGTSYYDHQPVSKKIRHGLFWTLLLNFISFGLAFAIAVPLGVRMAVKAGSRFDRRAGLLLFGLYSLPRFWTATLLLVFLTTSYYATWLDWFPGPGLGDLPLSAPFWERFVERTGHLLLPVFTLTYPMLAFIARQVRGSMVEALSSEYVLAARARGVSERKLVWRHAFRNALFPLITVIASIIPASIAGSVVVEQVFAIPGMGLLMFESILRADWPVVFSVLLFGALLTMLGLLIADLLYAWADPRVKFGKKQGA